MRRGAFSRHRTADARIALPLHDLPTHTWQRVWGYAIFEREAVERSGPTQAWSSSPEARRHFCPTCGSVAYMEYLDRNELDIPLGAFDETGLYEPEYELWCCHKEPWLPKGVRTEYERDRSE